MSINFKPDLNKCLRSHAHTRAFSFSCITMVVPHQLFFLFFRFPAASWLSLSPGARWEVRAKLIHLFVVETPRASATGYWSAHEKFRAAITSLLKVKCVSHYPATLSDSSESWKSSRNKTFVQTPHGARFKGQNFMPSPTMLACDDNREACARTHTSDRETQRIDSHWLIIKRRTVRLFFKQVPFNDST